jgi:hypothetical protein
LIAIGSTGLMSTGASSCTAKHPPLSESIAGAAASVAGSSPSAGRGVSAGRNAMLCSSGMPAERECFVRSVMETKAAFGCGQIAIMPTPTTDEVKAKFLPNGCLKREATCNGCCVPAVAEGEPQSDGSCCYTFCSTFCCGRPFLIADEPRLAAVMLRSDWMRGETTAEPASPLASRMGSEWLEDARMEHASIASFARFTLDLLAHGAPPELVDMAQRAALDEVEHARLCFGLAARYSALDRGPAPLSAADMQVAPSLWHAAVAAFREGCVGETLAALHARAALERAQDPQVRRALTRIADDEARHAELAWRFVAWAMPSLGPEFAAEMQRTLGGLLSTRTSTGDDSELTWTGLRDVVAPCVAALSRPANRTVHALDDRQTV